MSDNPFLPFKRATDEFMSRGVKIGEIADALGISYASVKQARLDHDSPAYRKPPVDWELKLETLARERSRRFYDIADRIEADMVGDS